MVFKVNNIKSKIYKNDLYNSIIHWKIETWNFLRHLALRHSGFGWIALLVLISCMIFLPACAPSEREQILQESAVAESTEEAGSPPSREAVFVYGDHGKDGPPNISLQLNAEPIQLSSVYVRLAGIIVGVSPVALVEVGGKGFCVKRGDKVKEYRVISISPQEINLRRVEEKDNV